MKLFTCLKLGKYVSAYLDCKLDYFPGPPKYQEKIRDLLLSKGI